MSEKTAEYGIDENLLMEKFKEAISDFTGERHSGWVIDNQLGNRVLVKEFEMNGRTFQCILSVTRDEDDFI
ncbi:MAG TPA: hypothetical protein VEB40_10255 [Flavipsychrobacter sp.]|nr:hypothetical protein [Flavipsychrobacter sp.]